MIHPQKRTWNLRIPDWKKEKTPIYKAPILGFHVSFRGFALEPRCLLRGFYPISAPRNLKSSRSFFRVLPRPSICSVCPLTAFLTKVWLLEVESQLHQVTVGYQWCLRWIRSHGHESFDPLIYDHDSWFAYLPCAWTNKHSRSYLSNQLSLSMLSITFSLCHVLIPQFLVLNTNFITGTTNPTHKQYTIIYVYKYYIILYYIRLYHIILYHIMLYHIIHSTYSVLYSSPTQILPNSNIALNGSKHPLLSHLAMNSFSQFSTIAQGTFPSPYAQLHHRIPR